MTNPATPAPAGGEAQPIADANSIDSIVDAAVAESTQATKETPEAEATEPNEPAAETEEAWPKKAENALAKAKGKAAQLRAERDQERTARQRLEQQLAQYSQQQPQPKSTNSGNMSVEKTGIPTKLVPESFTNWADYSEARAAEIADYKISQKFAEHSEQQTKSYQAAQEQARLTKSLDDIGTAADKFIADVPDAQEIFDECEDTLVAMPDEIKRVFLEIGPGAELAVYNMAKEGKLEALASMSAARAAAEIGRAMTQAIKPRTKAPTPLPASRGSVAGGKRLEDLSGDEMRSFLRAKS